MTICSANELIAYLRGGGESVTEKRAELRRVARRVARCVHSVLDRAQLLFRDEVDLVDDDAVGERDLLHRLVHRALGAHLVELALDELAVDQRRDAVDAVVVLQHRVGVEGLQDGRRVGEPRRLEEHGVELLPPLLEAHELLDEVAAHRAARAAIVHRDELLGRRDVLGDERLVDVDRAKLVLDHADLLAVLLVQDVVDERRLARAEEAGHHGDRELLLVRNFPVVVERVVLLLELLDHAVGVRRRVDQPAVVELHLVRRALARRELLLHEEVLDHCACQPRAAQAQHAVADREAERDPLLVFDVEERTARRRHRGERAERASASRRTAYSLSLLAREPRDVEL